MRHLIPHPGLSLLLVLFWLLLVNTVTPGNVVLGVLLALILPRLTSAWWPARPRIRRPDLLAAYLALVLWDIVVANFTVARIILFMPRDRIRSAWVAVPLDLRTPEAIALLAGTITMTPGTLTADMSACGRVLLVHALHAPDPDALCDEIKTRYEARLKRMFA